MYIQRDDLLEAIDWFSKEAIIELRVLQKERDGTRISEEFSFARAAVFFNLISCEI